MQCYSTIHIKKDDKFVPCGQCMPCRINKGRIWTGRILQEWATTPLQQHVLFLTLTYTDEKVPKELDEDGAPLLSLRKKHLQNYFKRCRNAGLKFRYYGIGEYGDNTKRPHYHAAIFPLWPAGAPEFRRHWQNHHGFCHYSYFSEGNAKYLAKYTTKKLTNVHDKRLKDRLEPEFRISSRKPPLGKDFVEGLPKRTVDAHIKEHGDVPTTFRMFGKIWPIGPWGTDLLRQKHHVSRKQKNRIKHFKKYDAPAIDPPNEIVARALENQLYGKAKERQTRYHTL